MIPPATVLSQQLDAAPRKVAQKTPLLVVLGALAGAFIALGAAASNAAAHSVADAGLARLVCGLVFPVGLVLVVLLGAELFTGNNLLAAAVAEKKISAKAFARNLGVVWLANLLGALLVVAFVAESGTLRLGGGALGAYTVKVAAAKAALSPCAAFASGVLCNVLVCTAILAAAASKHVEGKIPAVFLPVCAFVVCGFEHSVANMYYLPAGAVAARVPDYAALAAERWGVAGPSFWAVLRNLLWVTLGNLFGGVACVALPVWYTRRDPPRKRKGPRPPRPEFTVDPPPETVVADAAPAADED